MIGTYCTGICKSNYPTITVTTGAWLFVVGFMFYCGVCVYWCPTLCHFIQLYVFISPLWCPLCFQHQTIFGSFLHPVAGGRVHVLFMLFVFICVQWYSARLDYAMSSMAGVLSIRDRSCLLFASTCMVYSRFVCGLACEFFLVVWRVCLRIVCSKMPVSLNCPFLFNPSVF